MAQLDFKYYDYQKISKLKPMTKFEDIKVGQVYHIPPTILYDRRDFIVKDKQDNILRGQIREGDGNWHSTSIFASESTMKFLVEVQTIGNETTE